MSRHNYSEDLEQWSLIRWRGAVTSAIRGRKGQALLKELAAAMDAMPSKRLIRRELQDEHGEVCALGVICKTRQLNVSDVDPEDSKGVARLVGIADAMVREIEFENDDGAMLSETPERRWQRIRRWVSAHIASSDPEGPKSSTAVGVSSENPSDLGNIGRRKSE